MKRICAFSVLGLVAGSALVALTAAPAHAAIVTVTTTADVVNGGDGLVSLREAVDQANAAVQPTTIDLGVSHLYSLSSCGADEDANASGDLDYTGTQALTVNGNGSTIDAACAGQRVLDQHDDTAQLTLSSVTMTSGDNSDGAALRYAGDVDLSSVTASGNNAGAGTVLNSAPAAMGASIDVTGSTVGPNTGNGLRISFGTVTITGTTFSQNSGQAVGLTDGALTVADSQFTDNGAGGVRTTGQGEGLLTFANSVSQDNGGPGLVCSACGDLVVTDSTISGNLPSGLTTGGGIVWNVDQDSPLDEATATITNSTVAGNTRTGPGGGMFVGITELFGDPPPAQIVIDRSTFSGNTATGMDGRGGGIYAATGEVRVDNSTFTGNTAAATGGALYSSTGDLFLRHATIAGNTATIGSNLGTGEDLNSFASIVAGGTGMDECAITGTTISTGYNVGGDLSCAFVMGPGDQTGVGDHGLGALGDNGGPTQTMQPAPLSPAAGAVPAVACTVLTVDQRGVTRPQGTDCESGSVEIGDAMLLCTQTGTPGRDVLVGGAGVDVLCGLGGADLLIGAGGADTLVGGPGEDLLLGGSGDDVLLGEEGRDVLVGGPGTDELDGGPGLDLCLPGDGHPTLC